MLSSVSQDKLKGTKRQGRGARLIGAVAAMGGTYEFAKTASANLREKNDSWNPTIGGFLAGSMMGLRCEFFHGFEVE